jgi:hypothetical protein
MLRTLWNDDCGAGLLSSEFLFLYSTLVLGGVSGMVAMRQAGVSEFLESAQALLSLNQSYSLSGQSNCASSTAGSSASDGSNGIMLNSVAASNAHLSARPLD